MLHDVGIRGFSTHQAEELLKQYGLNTITEQHKAGLWQTLLEQFSNFLTILLLIAAVLSFFIGEPVDGGLIMAIVILNALFGIYQEKKASDAIGALKNMAISRVRVLRDGKEVEVDSRYLVPGDVIFIEEGGKVPADGELLQSINLEVNEATLTGESIPVEKAKKDEVFMGTIVARGRGIVEVTQTGMHTKFGQIAGRLSQMEEQKTPLQIKLEGLSKTIGILGIIISVVVFVLSILDGTAYFPAFLLAISLAVAVVPEGLPAVMTITLSIGVKEMAKKKAIVRKLSAIEALGNITLIATDKTGTLTANKMKVKEVFVDGKGYDESKLPTLMNHAFARLVMDGILCSTTSLVYVHAKDGFDVLGDPTEGALLFLAQKVGWLPESIREQWKLVQEIPFDSISKKMTVVMESEDETVTLSKGAFESILNMCEDILVGNKPEKLTRAHIERLETIGETWAKRGFRVLAFSYKDGEEKDREQGHIFLGMVAIHDPPRPEAREAIMKAHHAGIKVVMITGDNEKTAEAVGTSVGLLEHGQEIITGHQLDEYTDEELLKHLPNVRIFARVTPFHKSRIVSLFQQLGEVVAVTGDGVNDAIALKQADVGVAMGAVGTDVARETADMIIVDDNFATIVRAIEEGRNIIKNLKNAIKYLLACNISEALSLMIGLALGVPALFYAIQLLYINLVTDGIPALSLAFSPREESVMDQRPNKVLQLLNKFDVAYIVLVGLAATGIVMGAFYYFEQNVGKGFGKTAAFSILSLIQSFIFIDAWLSHRAIILHARKLFSGIFFIAFSIPVITQLLILTIPTLAAVFKVNVVSWSFYIVCLCLSSGILLAIFGIKFILRRKVLRLI